MSSTISRIERGAALLDLVAPGWEAKIDLDTLRLNSCFQCVLGQLYGDFSVGLDTLDGLAERYPVMFGFLGQVNEDYERLTEKWKRAILLRLRRKAAA